MATAAGTHWGVILTVAFTGLTALIASLAAVLGVLAFLHDRRRAGLGRSIVAPPMRTSWVPPGLDYLPDFSEEKWAPENVRYLPTRLHNLADYDTRIFFEPDKGRAGWLRRPVDVMAATIVDLPARQPQTFAVVLHRKKGWGERKRWFVWLRWETNTRHVRIHRLVRLKPIPDEATWVRLTEIDNAVNLKTDPKL